MTHSRVFFKFQKTFPNSMKNLKNKTKTGTNYFLKSSFKSLRDGEVSYPV